MENTKRLKRFYLNELNITTADNDALLIVCDYFSFRYPLLLEKLLYRLILFLMLIILVQQIQSHNLDIKELLILGIFFLILKNSTNR